MSTITVTKSAFHGWQAEDMIPFEPEGYALQITTMKSGRGAATSVTRVKLDPDHPGVFGYTPSEDFMRVYSRTSDMRVTSKLIAEVHGKTLAKLETIKAEVRNFYAAKS